MYTKQRGITLIGWLFLLTPIAIVGYAGIRIVPVYLNHLKVVKSIKQTASQHSGDESISAQAIRNTLNKHMDIESISYPTDKEIVVRREGQTWSIRASYEDIQPMFGPVFLLVRFDESVQIK
jgi:hypothetical protein